MSLGVSHPFPAIMEALLDSVEWLHSLPDRQDARDKTAEILSRLAKLCLGIKQFNKLVLIVVLF